MQRDLQERRTAVLFAQAVEPPGVPVHEGPHMPPPSLYVVNHICRIYVGNVSSHVEVTISESEHPPAAENGFHNC